MTRLAKATPERTRPRASPPDRFAARRAELAAAALETLAELGYARTSLREIAQHSPYSHGVLHYYFTDKLDLLTDCVRAYRDTRLQAYDTIVADAPTADHLRLGFARGLATALVQETALHRLWYDLRSQSMFEPTLRRDVAEIDASIEAMAWRVVTRYAELAGVRPVTTSAFAYALLDGLFEHALVRQCAGDERAAAVLHRQVRTALDQLVPRA